MVGVDGGGRVDLQTVVVFAGVLEETVHGVEHLMGQQEEPFPAEGRGEVKNEGCRGGLEEEQGKENDEEKASSSPRGREHNSRMRENVCVACNHKSSKLCNYCITSMTVWKNMK